MLPSRPCAANGMNTPSVFASAAIGAGARTTCRKCGEPISSSPSATSTRFTGSLRPAALNACSAARNADCGPFWLVAPRPITTLPSPGISTRRASHGGDDHSAGFACFTSYMKYTPRVCFAPASSVAKTPGTPSVGMRSTCWKPASRSNCIMWLQPSSVLRPSAAMVGVRIQSCNRCTDSSCKRSASRYTGARSLPAAKPCRAAITRPSAVEPMTKSRRLSVFMTGTFSDFSRRRWVRAPVLARIQVSSARAPAPRATGAR